MTEVHGALCLDGGPAGDSDYLLDVKIDGVLRTRLRRSRRRPDTY